jgi:hypothetical protein
VIPLLSHSFPMNVTLSVPRDFRGAITVSEDPSSPNEVAILEGDHVIVPIPPSGELLVKKIPFTQEQFTGYDAQWSDGTRIPDGTIQKGEPDKPYFYYMFIPKKNPRAEYFFVGTPSEKDLFLQKAPWV